MKGEEVGENVLDKTTKKNYRGGTGTPLGYKTVSPYFM